MRPGRQEATSSMDDPRQQSPEQEGRYHTYTTHRIPVIVHVMWVAFWVGLIWYVLQYAIPAMKVYF